MGNDAASMQMQWCCIDATAMMVHQCKYFDFLLKNVKILKIWKSSKNWPYLCVHLHWIHYSLIIAKLKKKSIILCVISLNDKMQRCSIGVASLQYCGNTNITSSDAASLCTIETSNGNEIFPGICMFLMRCEVWSTSQPTEIAFNLVLFLST